ncbi:MAG TPA: ABC transporter ATP-binding protein [Planctomycetota bacterium]|jgi:putative ABC transport system ATP-binding protein|nr:ABC transporter ATP-binding protein [Planctomycetota bacterium]
MTELVRTDVLTRRYVMGENVLSALDGVSLSFEQGEVAAIVGRSGSGKSTLLQLLGGLDRPTSGNVLVRGRRLAECSEDELALYRRSEVGFIFQFFNLVPSRTALQNVELPLVLAGVPKNERQGRADALLERVGLKGRRDHRPNQLSGGEQQRVAIARALVHDPPLLLADEPTGNLDSRTAMEILDLLRTLSGKTILVVTHDRSLADSFARRTVELRDGKVVTDERR